MRAILFTLTIGLLISCSNNYPEETVETLTTIEIDEVIFDSIKAHQYGADEWGMKQYVIALLKKGPNRDLDSATAYNLQMAHMENIGKMADAGQLVLAGPFMHGGEIRGLYIFNVTTVEEAKALTETDPAIKAGSLTMELLPWFGTAALMGVNDEHKRVMKIPMF